MINDFLQQIINLNAKVEREREDISKMVEQIEKETREQIHDDESRVLNAVREKCKEEYDIQLKEAKELKAVSESVSEVKCNELREAYEAVKEKAARQIVRELLEESIKDVE